MQSLPKPLLPKIPSVLEQLILDYSNYCNICNIIPKNTSNTHLKTNCIKCNKILCFSHDDGIWYIKFKIPKLGNFHDLGSFDSLISLNSPTFMEDYICDNCRYKFAINKNIKYVNFTYIPSFHK